MHRAARKVAKHLLRLACAGPADRDGVGLRRAAEPERERAFALAHVAAAGPHLLPLHLSFHLERDDRADRIAVASHAVPLEHEPQRLRRSIAIVAKHSRRPAVGREHEVEVAIAIKIGRRVAAADERHEEIGSRPLRRDRFKPAATSGVPEKLRRLGVGLSHLHLGDLRLEVTVAGQQVGPPVEIVVEKGQTELQMRATGTRHTHRQRRVGEEQGPCGIVTEKRVGLVGEVADRHRAAAGPPGRLVDAHPRPRPALGIGHARSNSDLGEPPAAQCLGRIGSVLLVVRCISRHVVKEKIPHGVVGDKDVGPAVVVGIGHADAERLRDALRLCASRGRREAGVEHLHARRL